MEAVIICVPTPLNKNREPDISYILNTGRSLAPHLRKGTLVVLESTTYPGTTDEDLRGGAGSRVRDESRGRIFISLFRRNGKTRAIPTARWQ